MKPIIASLVIAVGLIAGAIILGNASPSESGLVNNVSVVGDTQIVEVVAKGGYSPKVSVAKAGMPTTLRLKTNNTFDCSLAVAIPSLGYRKNLKSTEVSDISLPAQQPGTTLQGVCAMGMYGFQVRFQ